MEPAMFLDVFDAATQHAEPQGGIRVQESADQMLHVTVQPTREREATLRMKQGWAIALRKLLARVKKSNRIRHRCVANQMVNRSDDAVEWTMKLLQKQLDYLSLTTPHID